MTTNEATAQYVSEDGRHLSLSLRSDQSARELAAEAIELIPDDAEFRAVYIDGDVELAEDGGSSSTHYRFTFDR